MKNMELKAIFVYWLIAVSSFLFTHCRAATTLRHIVPFVENELRKLDGPLKSIKDKLDPLSSALSMTQHIQNVLYPDACWKTGLGPIAPFRLKLSTGTRKAFCDIKSDGGGWILFQRHVTGTSNFYRDWEDSKNGFGNTYQDFWLGNEALHELTSGNTTWEFRIDGLRYARHYYGVYKTFKVDNEASQYKLTLGELQNGIGGFRSKRNNKLFDINNMKFTTPDRDNDKGNGNCATLRGPFWHNNCGEIYPNAPHYYGTHPFGMAWFSITGWRGRMDEIELKMKEHAEDAPHDWWGKKK